MREPLRTLAIIACASALLGVVHAGYADEASVDDLLRRGVALRRGHHDAEALAVFEEVLARAPSASTRAQIALAEQALGLWLVAERDLDAALSDGADAWISKNGEVLRSARAFIEGHLGWLTVGVDVANASITVAGESVVSGAETRVVAGDVALDVHADSRLPAHRVVPVLPNQHAVLAITLDPVRAPTPSGGAVGRPSPPAVPRPESPRHAMSPGPFVLGGLGLVALATGAYFGIRTIDFKSERDGACTNGCLPAASNYDLSARSSAAASTVAFGVGAGMIVAGVTWWLVDRGRIGAKRPAVEVVPVLGAATGGLLVQGAL